ncbi:MAG: hypothetical protein AABY15_09055 [Nanoarchaeota archaeon]
MVKVKFFYFSMGTQMGGGDIQLSTMQNVQKEVNDFIKDKKFIDLKPTGVVSQLATFAIIYEERENAE